MNQEILEKYLRAGRILYTALESAKQKVKPGVELIQITKLIEDELIRNKGYSPAFPLNIGVNEITAHYACATNDTSIFPQNCLVKLDAGVHVDGYTTDMAITVQCGTDIYQTLIDAAEVGLETAINTIKAGVKVRDVGIAVENAIRSYGVQPISNLSGHLMTQFKLHAGISVPSIRTTEPSASYQFKEGDIFALEPFATSASAAGYVKNGKDIYIYSLMKRKLKNMPAQIVRLINKIWSERRQLPFSFRWFNQLPQTTLNKLLNQSVLHGYPVLIEASNHPVAQAEKTVLVERDACKIITK